ITGHNNSCHKSWLPNRISGNLTTFRCQKSLHPNSVFNRSVFKPGDVFKPGSVFKGVAMKTFNEISIRSLLILFTFGLLSACGDNSSDSAGAPVVTPPAAEPPASAPAEEPGEPDEGFTTNEIKKFNSPWAMTFLPDGRL